MTADALEDLRRQLRDGDRDLLRAFGERARFPRHPGPDWMPVDPRLPPPPLAELLYAIAPAGTAADLAPVHAANRRVVAALAARQRLAAALAEEKARRLGDDDRAALETGDRDKLSDLLADLPAELRRLAFVRDAAAELAPTLPPGLAPFLWREYLLPWIRQSEVAQLLDPR